MKCCTLSKKFTRQSQLSLMLKSNLSTLTPEEAHRILKQFDNSKQNVEIEYDRLSQALLIAVDQSNYQILGICAETFAQGYRALQDYTQALGYALNQPLHPIDGSVYIKFNPKLGSCYVDSYTGEYRGVLVSCQSDDASGMNEMYGHLPLNLFEDTETN
jgi:Domain of unknown function (DUF1824)